MFALLKYNYTYQYNNNMTNIILYNIDVYGTRIFQMAAGRDGVFFALVCNGFMVSVALRSFSPRRRWTAGSGSSCTAMYRTSPGEAIENTISGAQFSTTCSKSARHRSHIAALGKRSAEIAFC